MRLKWLGRLALPLLLSVAWAGTVPNECGMALQQCKQKNNCAKTPDSNECKNCQKAYQDCYARSQKPKAPTVPGKK
ncbi:MAG: hypothetical protein HY821_06545 [Acidobacteria bacterium]|nr:hypothetical protein [Acidobacteriota bacterium]